MDSYRDEAGYLQLLRYVLENGDEKKTRNGIVLSCFGKMISFYDIKDKFPILTSKRVFFRGVIEELLWFLRGSIDSNELRDKKVNIWNGNSSREYLDSIGLNHYREGELGPVYGWQWKSFGKKYKSNENGFDQIKYVIEELLKPENSRRAVITGWNPSQLHEMALPPCHILYVFYKDKNGLHCSVSMRSTDLFLGLPFNITSVSVLVHIIAKVLHMKPHGISINMTDLHIYKEHIDGVNEQLQNNIEKSPVLEITKECPDLDSSIDEKMKWIESLRYDDFSLNDYKHNGTINAPMK